MSSHFKECMSPTRMHRSPRSPMPSSLPEFSPSTDEQAIPIPSGFRTAEADGTLQTKLDLACGKDVFKVHPPFVTTDCKRCGTPVYKQKDHRHHSDEKAFEKAFKAACDHCKVCRPPGCVFACLCAHVSGISVILAHAFTQFALSQIRKNEINTKQVPWHVVQNGFG